VVSRSTLSPDCGQIMPGHPPQSTNRAWLASTSKSTAPEAVKGVDRIGNGLGSRVAAVRISAARRIVSPMAPEATAIAALSICRLVRCIFVSIPFLNGSVEWISDS
jgi:hypothetical protein